MNATRVMVVVIKYVLMRLGHIIVNAMMAGIWTVMDWVVQV